MIDMKPIAKITILEVTNRPTYELVSVAGPERPIYIGSTEWRERQENIDIQTNPPFQNPKR
jgi:hypothetical protein